MTQSLEVLARRTTSMQGIRSVVHTMKSLSVINAAPYEQAARAIEAYHQTVLTGLHAFLSQSPPMKAQASRSASQVIIVFGSDHGLCGNYNDALAAQAAPNIDPEKIVLCVGAQMAGALSDLGIKVEKTFMPPASVDGIGRLANLLTLELDGIRMKTPGSDIAVTVAFFAQGAQGLQTAEIKPLLPLDAGLIEGFRSKPWVSRSLPFFTMPPDDLFLALIHEHLFASLYRAAAEAMVTENAARLALMQQAEQSVDDRLDALKADTRAMRQSEITNELLDVIIGFEALKKDKRRKRG
ncbi:FoF1 ATP synthase subunit gamma [Yoonia sp. I 8.24]|uniref:F0F1 ATP synthase subunit gamma n=1 Tax=Yoonia sp. I 8.24 TaxID=1537229 RepID=UPI001EDF8FAB|nr:FoF1 ATP synthase subunit gamma [Yoonia sp. I 8.24]MCG3268549.1 F0F1 ATP synthase subunit gamma [Yoonia sp. I 8.24]